MKTFKKFVEDNDLKPFSQEELDHFEKIKLKRLENDKKKREAKSFNQPTKGIDEAIISYVKDFTQQRPSESCPIPQLYREVIEKLGLSICEFQDKLRNLTKSGHIRLIEWTQPLRTMPDEQFALILGGEIRYYVRIK